MVSQPEHMKRAILGGAVSKGYLEIRRRDGKRPWRHPLTGSHQRIGRSPDTEIFLDHSTVSRNHAELLLGPFGNWWLHDLGSTNGTYVNGSPVRERMLNPGDRVGVGDFTLCLHMPDQRQRVPSMMPPPLEEDFSDEEAPISEAEPTMVTTVMPEVDGPPQINASHLTTVMALGRQLMSVEEATGRMKTLCEFMVGKDFPAESAVVVRMRQGKATKLVCGPYYRDPMVDRGRYVSSSVLETLWTTREPVLATNRPFVDEQAGVGKLSMPGIVRMISVIACPLEMDEDKLDLLYVEFPPAYATAEWLTLVALAAEAHQQAELVWQMRSHVRASAFVERELEMARQIQEGLVPRSMRFEGLDAAIGFEPCRWVGGDYVDVIPMPDGRLLLAIADVCGKGLQAALVASSLHTMVRATADAGSTLAQLVTRANKYLCEYLPDHSFVTMVCVALDVRTGELECVNAGHPPPLVVGPSGELRQLQSEKNVALGIIDSTMEAEQTTLTAEEVLITYTDGLTELLNESHQPLGEDRFGSGVSSIIATDPRSGVHTFRRRLIEMVENYRGSQLAADDCTFLIARRR